MPIVSIVLVRELPNDIYWMYILFSHENTVKKYFLPETEYYNFLQLTRAIFFLPLTLVYLESL